MDPETDDSKPTVSGPDENSPSSASPDGTSKPAPKKPSPKKPSPKKPATARPTAQVDSTAPSTPVAPPATKSTSVKKSPPAKSNAAKPIVAKSTVAKSTPAKSTAAKKPALSTAAARTPVVKSPATTVVKVPEASTSKALVKSDKTTSTPASARKTPASAREGSTGSASPSTSPKPGRRETVLKVEGLSKRYGQTLAVDDISLSVSSGTIFGIVGPNGAGKTTTLSMVTGLLRPDAGTVHVHGIDVWADPAKAKSNMGVLPDRLRLFDRLTGGQLLHYSGVLRGLSGPTVKSRSADLAVAFGLEDALGRLVTDYSAGMTKKIALAAAMLHSPRLLVLDEPFESVDPVSAANIIEILQKYTEAGGTVMLSSHSMDLIQRICDSVAIIVDGKVLAAGTMRQVRGTKSLEQRFVELAGGRRSAEGMEWLHSFSD